MTVGACGPAPTATAPTTPTTTTPSTTPTQQAGTIPVKLRTTKVKRAKARKSVAFKLTASEPLTKLSARLRKGKRVVGKGKLAKLSGNGTLKVKLSKATRKGKYLLDMAATDAQGRARSGTFTIAVK